MNYNVPTPHITAKDGDFAKTVLMPGDPLRAKLIAENYLKDAVLVNNVRGVQGYTGTYKGKRVSVMASGMGCPSMGIYALELFSFYNVENIIRIGSAGAISDKLKLQDIVVVQGVCTNSNFANQYRLSGTFAPIASFLLLEKAVAELRKAKIDYSVGNVLTSDVFYDDAKSALEWRKMGVLAVEMECAALYMTAARCGKNALALCTVSDFVFNGEKCTAEERQNSFTKMIEIALEVA